MSRKSAQPTLIPLASPTQWPELVNVAACPPSLVTLIDGRQVDSGSEDWRAECEARRVLRMPTKAHRHAYLHAVAKRRGQQAREALETAVLALWRAGRAGQDDGDA